MIGWRRRKARRDCFHHDERKGESWIAARLINNGAGKMFWCTTCGQTWFV